MKIEKLTKKQEKQLVEFRQKMLDFGRSTQPSDRITTEEVITDFYARIGKKKPMFFWFDGPYTGYIAVEIIRNHLKDILQIGLNLRSNLWQNLQQNLRQNLESNLEQNLRQNLGQNLEQSLGQNLWPNLEQNLRQNLGSNLWQNLRQNLESNLGQNLWPNLVSNLEQNLRQNLGSNLRQNLRQNLGSNLEQDLWQNLGSNLWQNLEQNLGQNLDASFFGQHSLSWLAFYDFCRQIGVPYSNDNAKLLEQWMKLSYSTSWWVPFKNICFCFERHSILKVNNEGRLHCENGPAMAFRDGHELYYLNGVAMSKEQVITPAEQLNPSIILKETNVEVRRELLRKIGVERFIQEVGAQEIDSMKIERLNTEYTLLSVNLSEDVQSQKYLKMLNPSVGIWHVEGVDNTCNTVKDAIHSRKPKKLRDLPVDDKNGEDWYQQGDVAIWKRNSRSVKSLPAILT